MQTGYAKNLPNNMVELLGCGADDGMAKPHIQDAPEGFKTHGTIHTTIRS